MSIIDEMERYWRQKIASLRQHIERLEAEHGWRGVDTTQEMIARDKALITPHHT
jgi:hypothetical protein